MSVADMNKELRFYWTICAHPTITHFAHFGACYYNDCVRDECPLWDKEGKQ